VWPAWSPRHTIAPRNVDARTNSDQGTAPFRAAAGRREKKGGIPKKKKKKKKPGIFFFFFFRQRFLHQVDVVIHNSRALPLVIGIRRNVLGALLTRLSTLSRFDAYSSV